MKNFMHRFLNIKKIVVAIIAVFVVLALVTTSFNIAYAKSKTAANKTVEKPSVKADSYIIMSGSTSEIVYDGYMERRMSMGSITKLMTAMIVIDDLYDNSEYDHVITITDEISKYGDMFKVGESASVRDMLYAMLLGDSDEAAEGLARYSSNSRDSFINLMNAKAAGFGLLNTQFTNPTGLYAAEHYSTAVDCAVIIQYAMRYQVISDILSCDSYAIKLKGQNKDRTMTVTSSDPLLGDNKKDEGYSWSKGGILSTLGKPVSSAQYFGVAEKNGMQLIVVILNGDEDRIAKEAKGLFKYGYSTVHKHHFISAGKKMGKVRVKGGAWTKIAAYTKTTGYAYVPKDGTTDLINAETVLYDNVSAPLKAGDKIGEFRIMIAGELKGTVDLVCKKDVPKGWFPSKFYVSNLVSVLILLLILGVVALVLRIIYVKRRRQKLIERKRQQKIREEARKRMEIEEDRKRRNWTYR